MMELKQQEEEEVADPAGQYFNSSVLSVSVVGVLESQVPIDDSPAVSLLQDLFLPINPRFSSTMMEQCQSSSRCKQLNQPFEEPQRANSIGFKFS